MNNKKIFSIKLFWQSFKQLKIIGGICTALLFLLTILPPVTRALSYQSMLDEGGISASTLGLPVVINSFSGSATLLITFMIFTPILVLYAWNFLNKRNTSDFYHSLPYTRTCMYLTNLAAVVAWQIIILLVSFLSSVIVYAILSSFFIVDIAMIFRMYLSMWFCNLLCAGAISVACAVTGNVFSNICVSGLILFFPRLIVIICMMVIGDCVPVLSTEHFVPFLDNSYNMLTGICFSMFTGGVLSDMVLSVVSNVYTVVLALIYMAVGGLLFVKRKSEAAGKGASSKYLQTVIRSVIGFTICIIGVLAAVNVIRLDNNYHAYQLIYTIGLCFLIAAIVMAMYEWLSTKNIRNAVRCIPSILVTFVISLVFGFGVNIMADGILNYTPKSDSVDYVTLSKSTVSYMDQEDYFQNRVADIRIEDERIKEILCEALKDNVTQIKDEKRLRVYANNYNLIPYEVHFKDGLFGKYRKVYLTEKQMMEIAERLTDVAGYKDVYLNLPKAENSSISWPGSSDFSREEAVALYNTLLTESREVPFEEWYTNVTSENYQVYAYVTFSEDGKMYKMLLPVTAKMEKTMTAFFNAHNKNNAEKSPELRRKIQELLESSNTVNGSIDRESVSLRFYDAATDSYNYMTIREFLNKASVNGQETLKAIARSIGDNQFNRNYEGGKAYVAVSYSGYLEKDDRYEEVEFYVQLEGYETSDDYYR